MPLYEYACLDCNESFDHLRAISDADAVIQCPECGGDHTARSLSLVAAPAVGRDMPDMSAGSSCACGGACSCGGH